MRCSWLDENDSVYVKYHDTEWGIPVHDDRKLFEMLILEGFQAGLSWQCILHKREAFRQCFDCFDVQKVAHFSDEKIKLLMENSAIIRNKLKIQSAITNARIFIKIVQEFKTFDAYLWHWTKGKTIQSDGIETTNELSDKISKDLKKRGMKFVGSTIVFSYLCAVGVIEAHTPECDFRRH
ncbi:MAG: DNA-3-methyladenine glycosylase I [Alphaproteobacteria bacterium]|nr:DNA-3-methyladenine glycosylase I [Alphaproteobacteria bacterium]